jgi:hypothetical protein
VARLLPEAPGSFSVASYDSQGYGGSIRRRLHAVQLPFLASVVLLMAPLHGPFPTVPVLLHAYPFPRESVYRAVA